MGDAEPGKVHHPVSPEKDVEIESAWAPPGAADAPVRLLDVQEGGQEGLGGSLRQEGHHRVAELGLSRAHRRGGVERRAADHRYAGQLLQILGGFGEGALGVPEVSAETHVDRSIARGGRAHSPSTSRIPYWPGGCPCTHSAARSAPLAN